MNRLRMVRIRYFCEMNPDLYYFNPTCELAVVNGSTNFMAPAHLRRFENEVSILPAFLGNAEDIVLVDQLPSAEFCDQLEMAGFSLPSFQSLDSALCDPDFLSLDKGFLFPWGWSPAAHKLLSPLKPGCCPEFQNSPVANWNNMHRELYSRKSAIDILKNILFDCKSDDLLSFNDLPEICTTHEQIIELQKLWGKIVVKAPWSSSGRGLQVLRPNEYNRTNRQVISGFLKQQGFVVCGPWHQKILDFSLQFFSFGNGKIEFRGLTTFSTDLNGHYMGTFIQELPPKLQLELKEFLDHKLPELKRFLLQVLSLSQYSSAYYGWLGVDAIVYKSENGNLKIHPCLEINCRFTMGAIALRLRDHLSQGSTGEFRIMYGKEGDFAQFCEGMKVREPLIVESGKIVKGFLPLTPPLPGCVFGAWIKIVDVPKGLL